MSFFNADIRVTGSDGLVLKDLGTNATTPGSGLGTLYLNSGQVYIRNSSGTDTSLSSGGGGSTAADDITVGDSTVNLSTTSGNIIMHSVSNASNSIVMTSNSGASETIEIHNVQGTSNSSILLKSHVGGTTIEGASTNIDNISNKLIVSSSTPTSNGAGFAPMYFNSFITEAFGDKITTFHIDAQNLVVPTNSDNNYTVTIGKNDSNNSYFGRYDESKMGKLYKIEMHCLETPSPDVGASPIDVGFAVGSGSTYILSNGSSYSLLGGSGSGGQVTFNMTTNGYIKEIYLNTIGGGYNTPTDYVNVTGNDGTSYTFLYATSGSEKRVTFVTPATNTTAVSLTTEPGYPGSGMTVDYSIITVNEFGVDSDYPYKVSINDSGSGYDESIIRDNFNFYFGTTSGGIANKYAIGYMYDTAQTGSTDALSLSTNDSPVTVLSEIPIIVSTSLNDGDYFYLILDSINSSNVSLTAGKFLLKMYGSTF